MKTRKILDVHKSRDMNAYNQSMDKSIEEKYNQITSKINFKPGTIIVDFGTGTGILAYNIAKLHPEVTVVGSDISPQYVKEAKHKYSLPNLDFVVISSNDKDYKFSFFGKLIHPDYVIFSSVLHEVYSYHNVSSANPLSDEVERLHAVKSCLSKTREALNKDGKIIVRDFCGPAENRYLFLKLTQKIPTDYTLEEFCKNNKFNLYPLVYHKLKDNTYLLNEKTLYEYIYHKDWRECWKQEFEERYGFWTKDVALSLVVDCGYKKPIFDILSGEWIKYNRFFNKIKVSNFLPNTNVSCFEDSCNKFVWNDSVLPTYQILLVASK